MKKYIFIILSVALVAFMVVLFSGCSAYIKDNSANVSDIRYGVFDAECEAYTATFTYGMRENPYSPDGRANTKVEFGIISVIFTERLDGKETVAFTLKINDNIVSGTLEKSPFTDEYMADIGAVCADGDSLNLEINLNNGDSTAENMSTSMINKNSSWNINYEKAFIVGVSALANEIKEIQKANCSYEIYVKIITEQQTNFGTYFWAVSIIPSIGEKHTVVFTQDSEQILVKN